MLTIQKNKKFTFNLVTQSVINGPKYISKGINYANLGILAQVSDAQAIALSFPHQATALKRTNVVSIEMEHILL